jgi:tRNA U34 5-carboxymethylaminomethyl modifying enzyme MnmG/GidA
MPQSFPGPDHGYDLLVVGAGLAGSEAAIHAARAGLDTLLVTTSLDTLYMLASDKARLEPPPDTLMAELVAEVEDAAGFTDAWALHRAAKYRLEHTPGLHLLQSSASGLLVEDGAVLGVATWEGVPRRARMTALCVGSFLAARLRVGELTEVAGRLSEMAYDDLFADLSARGFQFEDARFAAGEVQGSLPYTVDCQVFAAQERAASGRALPRLARLYAAGVCVHPGLGYEESAAAGLDLGRQLVREAGRREAGSEPKVRTNGERRE